MSNQDSEGEELPVDNGELLSFIDTFLYAISGQSLVDSDVVQDFILDLRNMIDLKEITEDSEDE